MSDLRPDRETPPEDHEWPGIWRALDRANKSWIVTGPIHAAVTNWKAFAIIMGIVVWINRPEIVAAIRTLSGS